MSPAKAEHEWELGFYSYSPGTLPNLGALFESGKNRIVVVDFAEQNPATSSPWSAPRSANDAQEKIRLALLARNADACWERLADGTDGTLEAVLKSPSSKTGPYGIDKERVSLVAEIGPGPCRPSFLARRPFD